MRHHKIIKEFLTDAAAVLMASVEEQDNPELDTWSESEWLSYLLSGNLDYTVPAFGNHVFVYIGGHRYRVKIIKEK